MIGRCACLLLAAGFLSPANALGEAGPDPVVLESAGGLQAAPEDNPDKSVHAVAAAPRAEGNPLWAVPLSMLTATRERPVFSPSRRAPQQAAEPEAMAEAPPPPPPPAEPETPTLTLVGTVIGDPENIAIIHDDKTNSLVRIHAGESISGWVLVSVEPGTMTVEKNKQTVTVAMPAPGATPPNGPMVSQALPSGGAF